VTRNAPVAGARWLPPGPWPLRRGFVLWRTVLAPVLAAAGVLLAVLAASSTWNGARQLLDEAQVAASANGSADARFVGRVNARGWRGTGLFQTFEGMAIATDDGRRVAAGVSFALVVSSREDLPPLRVLYRDASHATTTNWHVATRGERWVALGLGLLAMIAAALAPLWVAWGMWRRARVAAAIAGDGLEVLATVDAVPARAWLGRPRWSLFASWELDGERFRQRIHDEPRHGGPLTVDERAVLLVSRHRPDRALVVREDLWPLRLLPHERDAILARITAHDEREEVDDAE
jgi:hypothetical protein